MLSEFSDAKRGTPVYLIGADQFSDWIEAQDSAARNWVSVHGFRAQAGQTISIPGTGGAPIFAAIGLGNASARQRDRFLVAKGVGQLPEGDWELAGELADEQIKEAVLGWLLASYRFDRYRSVEPLRARLIRPNGIDSDHLLAIARGEALTRDLINTPASDMGPAELEAASRTLAKEHGAQIVAVEGDALLEQNFPMVHAVGRASARAPRLIDMRWGGKGPKLTLVGKGVCFDTGGLNLKPGVSMGLMKKDMGGAAAVLGLAHMIMATGMKVDLRVLIPAVENSVSGSAFRPQDILTSRKGLTVEINNTDAEGRLVLADALALADEENPDLIVSMATLTGAARVAVGPDLAPYYTDDDATAAAIAASGARVADPVWRMPFHDPYESMIEPGIADLDNAPKGGFAGSITAALFLRRFVDAAPYVHFDIYGWQPTAAPARPKGGVGQGARALFDALPGIMSL